MYVAVPAVREVVSRDPFRPQNTAAALTDGQIEAAIVNAQAEVDARLRGRYPVPFDPVPALVASITLDVAAWLVTLLYREQKDIPDGDPAIRRYERAQCLLRDIATGMADLDAGDGGAPAPRTGGGLGPAIPRRDGDLFGAANFGLSNTVWW